MTSYDRIVFWQDIPSPHQAPWISALADLMPEKQVICVFQRDISPERISLGWNTPDYGRAVTVIQPAEIEVLRFVEEKGKKAIHVFSSFSSNSNLRAILQKSLKADARVGLLSEWRDWRGIKGRLRVMQSFFIERRFIKKIDFVLCIGHLAKKWYLSCGYNENKLWPFCYVVEKPKKPKETQREKKETTITYIGQFIKRKSVDKLIMGLAQLKYKNWILNLVGDGPEKQNYLNLINLFKLNEKIVFHGVVNNSEVGRILGETDLFIIPSSADGWGAVVNEALMCGVPVICSDFCGASDLIYPGFNGDVFKYSDSNSLHKFLEKWVSKGQLSSTLRYDIQKWSKCIEGSSVSKYFGEIIENLFQRSNEPKAPWLI